MKEINIENYEAYFLDFVEGNLSDSQAKMLGDFLKENPHLNSALDSYEPISVKGSSFVDDQLKNRLIREETTGLLLVDYLMIAQAEEVITPTEKVQLANIVSKNQDLLTDLALYHKTKLTKEHIVFPAKNTLKRTNRKGIFWIQISAAAAVILALLLMDLNPYEKHYKPKQIAYTMEQIDFEVGEHLASSIIIRETVNQEWLSKPVKAIIPDQPKKITPLRKLGKIPLIKPVEFHAIAAYNGDKEKMIKIAPNINPPSTLIVNEVLAENNTLSQVPMNEFISLSEFTVKTIKSELLNNKTLKATLLEELVELSNERLTLAESQAGKTQKFAINIGKFGYSNY